MEGINLALLPSLTVIKQLTHEEIVQAVATAAGLENASPADPAFRVALACAYRELMVRQDANEQARGLLLAFAVGPQLDHLGVTYYQHPDGSPVTRLDGEEDDDYRARLQDSPEGLSVAGPDGAYEFGAKSAHPHVKGASVFSPKPVEVELTILSTQGSGVPTPELLATVDAYLQSRRPLTDWLRVLPAEVVPFSVTAALYLKPGPDPELVRQASEKWARAYLDKQHRLKARVVESALHAAMSVEGVEEVRLTGWADVACTARQAPFCEALTVTIGGYV
ncbi:phage-related baseplate assembly protein [Pseudomonas sp. SJZ085]|uniref:baseplate assembly protein n=1 Tax=unclassified Pseudomonas TaxID=196821 RepID=UPI00119965B0|nr:MULTISPECIES: baseplate J/gp47 family protein [unclassified Pseudomonas]TWC12008.1 phage-related baseplate assembly protein [Pseudomonas sp. SJZ074]TWC30589.1 phage-related baseplate assembly protein [Pseudomonas sp. SJZ085]